MKKKKLVALVLLAAVVGVIALHVIAPVMSADGTAPVPPYPPRPTKVIVADGGAPVPNYPPPPKKSA